MKKLGLILSAVALTTCVTAQEQFTGIEVDWNDTLTIQVPKSPIKTQVLFQGEADSVITKDMADNIHKELAKGNNDFIGVYDNGGGIYTILVNHETSGPSGSTLADGGGMTLFKVKRNSEGLFETIESDMGDGRKGEFIDVDFANTVGETWNNCGGIVGPNGDIWTAEEYAPTSLSAINNWRNTSNIKIGTGSIAELTPVVEPLFKGETIKRYQNQGWMVSIDPKTGKALRKQYNWGRMSFEGGALMADNKTVFLTEDNRPGIFTKFVANKAGDFTSGSLYVYKAGYNHATDGNWIKIDNTDIDNMVDLAAVAYPKGATLFLRLEWAVEINGKVYVAETGYDKPASKSSWLNAISAGGSMAQHHIDRATAQGTTVTSKDKLYYDRYGRVLVYDPAKDSVSIFLEGGPSYDTEVAEADYPSKHLSNPDGLGKITINGKTYMLICEDLNGATYGRLPKDNGNNICDLYLLDPTIANPAISDLIRVMAGPAGAELTGATGTPDGNSILVDIQHPSPSNDNGYNHATTIAISGLADVADLKTLHFSVDWTKSSAAQYPASDKLIVQNIFTGGVDFVETLDRFGNPAGKTVAKEGNDFIGVTPDTQSNDLAWICVNHETTEINGLIGNGGGMTTFKIRRNASTKELEVVEQTLADGRSGKFFNVDFVNTVGETWTNCGGIIGPNGEIWTAEEYPTTSNKNISFFIPDTSDFKIGHGSVIGSQFTQSALFSGEEISRADNLGWMVKIDPLTGKAIQKQYNWGKLSFEGGAILDDNKTVIITEDNRPGLLLKFVATTAGDFNSGKLYAYKEGLNDPTNGNWVEIDNSDIDNMLGINEIAYSKGATAFLRLEWATSANGKIYFTETGYDKPASKSSWQNAMAHGAIPAQHHVDKATAQGTTVLDKTKMYHDRNGRILVWDPATDIVSIFLEGGPDFDNEIAEADYPVVQLSNPDGLNTITIGEKQYLLICEDLNGYSNGRLPKGHTTNSCELFMIDPTTESPDVLDLIRIMVGPKGAELTGAVGTPDGKSVLVDIQHPSADNPAPYNKPSTVALTGFDKLQLTAVQNSTDEMSQTFDAYPIPAQQTLYFNIPTDVELYTIDGMLVISKKQATTLNISMLSKGNYILKNALGDTKTIVVE